MFPQFMQLPPELRIQVWEHALLALSRTCELHGSWTVGWRGLPAPHIAYVCHEAREVVHKMTKSQSNRGRDLYCRFSERVINIGFVLPQDIIHLPVPLPGRDGLFPPPHPLLYLTELLHDHSNVSVHWPIPKNWVRLEDDLQRGTDLIRTWGFLSAFGPQATIMVNNRETRSAFETFYFPLLPRVKSLISRPRPLSSIINRKAAYATHLYTVDIFDSVLDEMAKTILEFQKYSGELAFPDTCEKLADVIASRERWKDQETLLKQLWVGICRYNGCLANALEDAANIAQTLKLDSDETRDMLARAPTFRPVIMFGLWKPLGGPFGGFNPRKLANDPDAPSADCEGGPWSWKDLIVSGNSRR